VAGDQAVTDEMRQAAHELAAPVERVFDELAPVAEAFASIASAASRTGRVTSDDLLGVRPLAEQALTGDTLLVGAGVVLEPGYLSDRERHLEWRQLAPGGAPEALLLDIDPASDDPYDYPEMEWFRVPRDEGRRMVGGPYFDYRGADRFALTFAIPVVVDGVFAGVAGADVALAHLESELLPVLRRIPSRAALLNHERRVVTANTPHFATGARVRLEAEGGAALPDLVVVPVVPDLGWTLVLTPST
jgi:hypothetical protein